MSRFIFAATALLAAAPAFAVDEAALGIAVDRTWNGLSVQSADFTSDGQLRLAQQSEPPAGRIRCPTACTGAAERSKRPCMRTPRGPGT